MKSSPEGIDVSIKTCTDVELLTVFIFHMTQVVIITNFVGKERWDNVLYNVNVKDILQLISLGCKDYISKSWASYSRSTMVPVATCSTSCSVHSKGSCLHSASQLYCSSTVALPK